MAYFSLSLWFRSRRWAFLSLKRSILPLAVSRFSSRSCCRVKEKIMIRKLMLAIFHSWLEKKWGVLRREPKSNKLARYYCNQNFIALPMIVRMKFLISIRVAYSQEEAKKFKSKISSHKLYSSWKSILEKSRWFLLKRIVFEIWIWLILRIWHYVYLHSIIVSLEYVQFWPRI